jgi:hypothetical protein
MPMPPVDTQKRPQATTRERLPDPPHRRCRCGRRGLCCRCASFRCRLRGASLRSGWGVCDECVAPTRRVDVKNRPSRWVSVRIHVHRWFSLPVPAWPCTRWHHRNQRVGADVGHEGRLGCVVHHARMHRMELAVRQCRNRVAWSSLTLRVGVRGRTGDGCRSVGGARNGCERVSAHGRNVRRRGSCRCAMVAAPMHSVSL